VQIPTAVAQLTAVSQTILKQLPPGTTPPLIIQYDASTVPILEFGISRNKLSEQQVFDITLNEIRVGSISVPGISTPYPYGDRQTVVSADPDSKAVEANKLINQMWSPPSPAANRHASSEQSPGRWHLPKEAMEIGP
jgi:multidrug efflux pump subunit AcrB